MRKSDLYDEVTKLRRRVRELEDAEEYRQMAAFGETKRCQKCGHARDESFTVRLCPPIQGFSSYLVLGSDPHGPFSFERMWIKCSRCEHGWYEKPKDAS